MSKAVGGFMRGGAFGPALFIFIGEIYERFE
jgi:hypothetical protein